MKQLATSAIAVLLLVAAAEHIVEFAAYANERLHKYEWAKRCLTWR